MAGPPQPPFDCAIAEWVWDTRYRLSDGNGLEPTVFDTWRRVARAAASVEARDRQVWERRFFDLMRGFRFVPGGRILAGAGSGLQATLFNCFVMGRIEDSLEGIFDALKEGALTMQRGGGVGYDFSTLRPAGTPARRAGAVASGPVSFMQVWNSMCDALLSTALRRGAMMATLRCDHPDIGAFIEAKRDPGVLSNFNLSVLVSDEFMDAVRDEREWPLVFPLAGLGKRPGRASAEVVERLWSGAREAEPCVVLERVRARDLWDRIMRAAYRSSEPGVLFVDRINRMNNLAYRERISATNPCGELPLPPYGACDLGALNIPRFVFRPFDAEARIDWPALERAAALAVRLLDNVIDLSLYPLPRQREQAVGSRRIGLGVTGLADALIMLGRNYGAEAGRELAAEILRRICHTAYRASIALAGEKGVFPFFRSAEYVRGAFVQSLPADIRSAIAARGIRNSHLLSIAPTGTTSLFAGNVSSGIEPVFDFVQRRRVRADAGSILTFIAEDYAYRLWRERFGTATPPATFVLARVLPARQHLAMQGALQPFVDNAISKTVNVAADCSFECFRSVYADAYELGLKGCTTFRPVGGAETGERDDAPLATAGACTHCGPEREGG